MNDAIKKKRINRKGEKSLNHKLKEEEVRDIRQSTKKHRELAIIYNVTFQQISNIKNYKSWGHIQ